MTPRVLRLALLLSLVAVLTLYATIRLGSRGQWLPPLPVKIGQWEVTEVPVNEEERNMLGNPDINGFDLTNRLQERVFGRIVAVSTQDSFLPPSLFQYYDVTADKTVPIEGGGKGLLQIYRQRGSELRIAMISWTQRPDGAVSLVGVSSSASRGLLGGIFGRFALGNQAVFKENRSCLVHLYTIIHPADPAGAQARRNVINAAGAVRLALLDGKPSAPSSEGELSVSEGGKDIDYLTDKSVATGNVPTDNLLSLKPGSTWEFDSVTAQGKIPEKVIVGGPRVIHGQTGVDVSIFRGGKLWRREVYQQDDKGLRLMAFGDATATLIEINPPLDLVNYPVKEGGDIYWKGTLGIRGRQLPTIGYARVSARENIVSPAGRFVAYRLDSVMTVEGEKPTHFPAIRWMAPGIGFVRRGYADEGKPAVAELKRFTVK
ncbi:MAG: hypothetical protein QM758_00235 [Armatimonas sp.]